jgi:ATP-dependent Lhr-like helicase
VLEVLAPMREKVFWDSTETRQKLRSLVPEYRLSKFQRVLPDKWQTEMVGGYLLDFETVMRVIGSAAGADPG